MREIKFRAWQKKQKMWVYFDLGQGFASISYLKQGLNFLGVLEPWQEYTGFKDRNGKEIYEGDFVKDIYKEFGGKTVEIIRQVIWDDDLIDGEYGYFLGSGLSFSKEGIIEVVGNVHQNPELLKISVDK